jgi:hypothetical protein
LIEEENNLELMTFLKKARALRIEHSVEISPVFPLNIDISKNNVVKLIHKETVDSVEQENKMQLPKQRIKRGCKHPYV